MKLFHSVLLFVLLFSLSVESSAQRRKKGTAKDGTEYSDKFHELFFRGLKESGLDNLEQAEKLFLECLKITRDEPAVYYELSKIYWTGGRIADALENAQKAYSLELSDEDLLRHYLSYTEATSEYKRSIDATAKYLNQLSKGSAYVEYAKRLANYYSQQGSYSEALKIYQDLEASYGYANDYAFQRFLLYRATNSFNELHLELDGLIQKNPKKASYKYHKAHAYNREDATEMALTWYNRALENEPNHVKALIESAQLLLNTDQAAAMDRFENVFESESVDVKDKLRHFSSLRAMKVAPEDLLGFAQSIQSKHSGNAMANMGLFNALKQLGRTSEGLPYLETAQDLDPGDFSILLELLTTYYVQGNYEQMAEKSSEGLELFPSQPGMYLYSGIASMELEDYDNAMITLETGKTYVLGNTSLRKEFEMSLAALYHNMGEGAISNGIFEDLLKDNKDDLAVLNNYAYFLSVRSEDLKKAESMIKKCLLSAPDDPTFLDTYGWIKFQQKDYKGAIELLKKAVAASPDDADILEHLGDAYAQTGATTEAVTYWTKAKGLGPASELLEKKIADKRYYEE